MGGFYSAPKAPPPPQPPPVEAVDADQEERLQRIRALIRRRRGERAYAKSPHPMEST